MKKYLQKFLLKKSLWGRFLKGTLLLVCVGSCLLGTGCTGQPMVQKSVDTAMGTIISQSIYTTGGDTGLCQEVLETITCLEEEYLSWRLDNSELYRLNESAGSGEGMIISDKLLEIMRQCEAVNAASGGAFDITIGAVAGLWNIDTWANGQQADFAPPNEQRIAEALSYAHGNKLKSVENQILIPTGVRLDLGAVGKGIAMDEILGLLADREELTGAVISVGGSILTYGSKPDGSSWNVAIVDPFDTSGSLGTLSLKGQWCISTSGDYERYVEAEGVRYHHILDPATGYPADSGVRSVTILTKEGFLSDALSTACFVLGVEKGMELAEGYGAEALFVDSRGEITMTEGMEKYFQLIK